MIDEAILKSIQEGESGINHLKDIRQELAKNPKTIVVLDDDPTGTQTVYDVPVVTQWGQEVINKEVAESPVFFILTNSRSLQAEEADALARLLGERLQKAAAKYRKKLVVISRGDSTLRGHYPNEVDALSDGLGDTDAKHLVIPAFFEGGRYTFNDTHYVREGNSFIPAAETPFAQDPSFGYQSSNLKDWISEKTKQQIKTEVIHSFDLNALRSGALEKITDVLDSDFKHFISNATCSRDLSTIALASLKAKSTMVFRTAASFVNAISGIEAKELLGSETLKSESNTNGGLVIVGSYVPKTSKQLAYAQEHSDAFFIELDLVQLLESPSVTIALHMISQQIDSLISKKKNVVLFTGRKVITGETKEKSLEIVNEVSQFLINIVKYLVKTPRYILTKGGITSSDIAVKALNVQRARVMGQISKGIPVWQLGKEAKFQNIPYIIFPGNVGNENTLYELIHKLS